MRASASLRGLVREHELGAGQLVLPLFVAENGPPREPISTLPGVERLSISALLEEAHEVVALGLGGVMLFGIPAAKDAEGSGAWDEEGVIQTAVRALKRALPELLVLTDVCLCEYTDHGHCGVLKDWDPTHRSIPRRSWTTTRRSSCSPASRSATPAPAPTSWPPRT